jgi:hypothetical protein
MLCKYQARKTIAFESLVNVTHLVIVCISTIVKGYSVFALVIVDGFDLGRVELPIDPVTDNYNK